MGFAKDINYYFKSSIAYTEDNVVVCNLFFYRMPRSVSPDAIQKYFSQFGIILKVYLVSDKKRKRKCAPKVGFVNFLDPIAAAKALKKVNHFIDGKRFMVKACDSWHQPGACGNEVNEESNNLQDSSHLLNLNDDCLISICKHLPLSDQMHLARVCSRLRDISSITCKSMYTDFNVDKLEGLTLWDIREFFCAIGCHIKKLSGCVPHNNRERILELICLYCMNVKSIHFNLFRIRCKCLSSLAVKMPHLTELKLRDCSLNDLSILALQKANQLENLDLSDNYEITGKNLRGINSNLTELNLNGCSNIQPTYFIELCHSLTIIRSLNIQRCDRINRKALVEMCRELKHLEVLKISVTDIPYEMVALIPKLKKLEIHMANPIIGVPIELLQNLATHAKNLTHLKFIGHNCLTMEGSQKIAQIQSLQSFVSICNEQTTDDCLRQLAYLTNLEKLVVKESHRITNDGVLYIVRSCPKLRHLNIQMCISINDNLIFDILQVLSKRKNRTTLDILAFQTSIHNSILKNCIYLEAEAKGLIKLYTQVPNIVGLEADEVGDSLLMTYDMYFLDDEDVADHVLIDEFDNE